MIKVLFRQIPSNKADFVTLITSRSDYKDRKARDEDVIR